MIKRCIKCKLEKPESDFNFKNKAQKLLHKQCKTCTRLLVRNHYNKNRKYYLDKARKSNMALKLETISYIQEYLSTNFCVDCNESNIVVLEFDHKDRKSKLKAISSLIRLRMPLEVIKKEIAKCEVRCANCHRRRTASQFNWLKREMHS